MIVPTIGRVILVCNRDARPKSSQPEPALICYVHNDRLINVGGFSAHGQHFGLVSVTLVQDDDEAPTGVYAKWMDYQKGQAAKTEELEKAAGSTNYYQRAVASGEIPPVDTVETTSASDAKTSGK